MNFIHAIECIGLLFLMSLAFSIILGIVFPACDAIGQKVKWWITNKLR